MEKSLIRRFWACIGKHFGWFAGSIVSILGAVYVIAMLEANRPHDMNVDMIMLYILLFSPAIVMLVLTFIHPKGTKRTITLISLGVSFVLMALSIGLLPGKASDKPMTGINRYDDACRAINHWGMSYTYEGKHHTPKELLDVIPKKLPENMREGTLELYLPVDDQPLMLMVDFVLDDEAYAETKKQLDERFGVPSVPEEEESIFNWEYTAYTEVSPIGERSVFYYVSDALNRVRIFVYEGNAGYVG